VRALLTFSGLWRAPDVDAHARPDALYKYDGTAAGPDPRQEATAGAIPPPVQGNPLAWGIQSQVPLKAKVKGQQAQIEVLHTAIGKLEKKTEINNAELKAAMEGNTDRLMAAIMAAAGQGQALPIKSSEDV